MKDNYKKLVTLRYGALDNLFLDLPFGGTQETGIYLPLLTRACQQGFDSNKTPDQIINEFLDTYFENWSEEDRFGLLFRFIQYVEREIVLFDAIEDASFDQLHIEDTSGTLINLIERALDEGKEEKLLEKLNDFSVRIVLTAHPTQFYPSQVLGIITDLTEAIRNNNLSLVNDLLHQLGKTPFFQKKKPTPYEEAVRLTWYLENVFYHSIPATIEELCNRLNIAKVDWSNTDLLRVGFWPGGDRDGNPFVTSETTIQVADRLKEVVLKSYYKDLRSLRRRLTFKGVEEIIVEAEELMYNAAYRPKKKKFGSISEFVDLLMNARELLINNHNSLFLEQLDDLILKAKIFGFHMSTLDIRQDSRKHRQYWKVLSNSDEITVESILNSDFPIKKKEGEDEVNEWLDTLNAIKQIQISNGEKACQRYIVSNSKDEIDVLIIYKMAQRVISKENELPLDLIPLFESIDDLANAAEVMRRLFEIPEYRNHLEDRGNTQTIMLGFSDGTKDGGYLRANWSIFRAKETLSQVAREKGIRMIFFDGRGGPPARGGGNTHKFYASQGDRIDTHEIQLTIQGQTISANYGQVSSSKYNLEQLLTAGIEGSLFKNNQLVLSDEDRELMEELADYGYEKYQSLKDREEFVPYLEDITPLKFFADTNIGSRPSRRGGAGKLTLGDLRAIPFVGSWGQMKQNVPGFYGVGTALGRVSQEGRGKELVQFYNRSLFFRTLLSNTMQSLEKANFKATQYLKDDPKFGSFWDDLYEEYKASIHSVLETSSSDELMEDNPDIRISIRTREKIVLPLITIQQFALQQLREDSENEIFKSLVIRTMFGIINAARNAA